MTDKHEEHHTDMPEGEPVDASSPAAGEFARRRLAAQLIDPPGATTPAGVVAALGAMQAQDYRSALWAVGVRSPGATEAAVEDALAGGSIVRTWLLRGTLHLVASRDVRWMLDLVAPRVIAAGASRRRQLGIEEGALARSRDLLSRAMSHGAPLARDEAFAVLEGGGVSTAGQRGIHILRHLSLEGLLCQTTTRGRQSVFVPLDRWVPAAEPIDREVAVAELALRYYESHGPATLQDFVWWSGLTVAEAREGLDSVRSRLESVRIGDAVFWAPPAPSSAAMPAEPSVALLPGFDEYILGYRDREIALDGVAFERIVPGGNGVFKPAIVADGKVIGLWSLASRTRAASVVELFSTTDAARFDARSKVLAAALRDNDRFARGVTTTSSS